MAKLARLGGFILDLTAERCLGARGGRADSRPAGRRLLALLGSARRIDDWVHPDDREPYREIARAEARRRGGPYLIEYRIRSAQDGLCWLSETGEHLAMGAWSAASAT